MDVEKKRPWFPPLAKRSEPVESKRDLIRRTIARDLEESEFELFMTVAISRGLDPLLNQIHAIRRWDKKLNKYRMTIQTAIDGFRLIASRTGEFAGRDETVFDYDNGKLVRAKVTIYRIVAGQRCPFTATARWDEYDPGEKNLMWQKMPEVMLAKCAETQALRMAFPNDLSGLYSNEEMHQADRERDVTSPDLLAEARQLADGLQDEKHKAGAIKYLEKERSASELESLIKKMKGMTHANTGAN